MLVVRERAEKIYNEFQGRPLDSSLTSTFTSTFTSSLASSLASSVASASLTSPILAISLPITTRCIWRAPPDAGSD